MKKQRRWKSEEREEEEEEGEREEIEEGEKRGIRRYTSCDNRRWWRSQIAME